MRRTSTSLIAVGIALLGPAACGSIDVTIDTGDRVEGSGEVVTEDRSVEGFNRVVLAGEGELTILQGDAESLTVETDDNLQEHIETRVIGDQLQIRTAAGINIDPTDSVTYRLTATDLDEVELSGAGTITMEQWSTTDAAVVLTGAGDIEVGVLAATTLGVDLRGAGTIRLAGAVEGHDVDLSGVGEYEAADLESGVATVVLSGAASATVWATDQLHVRISGTGSVAYHGSPALEQEVSGIGSVEALGPK